MKKTTVLISYPAMMIGGSTTSLLSILSRLDYNHYEVDLLLDVVSGDLLNLIPPEVNILEGAYTHPNYKWRKFHNILNPRFMSAFIRSIFIAKRSGNYKHGVQYLEMKDVDNYREIKKRYDVAISFLEGRNCKFVANHISAAKKIAWIHIDYKASTFNPIYDIDSLSRFNHVITVSQSCKNSFDECFPSLRNRSIVIENILSQQIIKQRSSEPINFEVDHNMRNIVTTCRIVFSSKGLDRAVCAMANMRDLQGFAKLRWYIIGDGPDMTKLRGLIHQYGLENQIILLGNITNPYPYVKQMDIFFLPSLWEGKPMAVTEAFMLGLPVVATNYLSAKEQIRNGIDGLIVENSQKGIEDGLNFIITKNNDILALKQNVDNYDYSNDVEMQKITSLLNSATNNIS